MYVLIFALILGLVPAAIAQSKGRSFFLWWIYGAAIWIVAFPHALIMKADQQGLEAQGLQNGQKKCPFCAELVRQEASVCKHCGRDLADHEPDSSGDLQPVANVSMDVASDKQMNAAPPSALGDNTERVVLGAAAAFLLFIFVIILVALNPTSPERRVVGRTVGNMAQTDRTITSPEAILPLAPPRRSALTPGQQVAGLGTNGAVVVPPPLQCREVSQHGFIRFLVCDPKARAADWRRAGREACKDRSVCNAWMWDRVEKAGTSLPMTEAEVNSAIAVWVHTRSELMDCRRTGC